MGIRAAGYRAVLACLTGLALAAQCQGGSPAAADPQQAALFKSYVQSPSYRAILEKGYNDAEPAVLKAECPLLKLKSFDAPEIAVPPRFIKGASGWAGVDGAWVQRATLDRCGKPVLRRAIADIGSNNSLRVHPLLPGEYGGDYKLETSVIPGVLTNAGYRLQCRQSEPAQVLDIKRTSRPNPNWTELWTIYLCGKRATARVAYTPLSDGAMAMSIADIAYAK